ncbi:nitrilase-related carbon-nitrogen hydrolase [Pseudonocardia sp. T1-2H]|uniref:nitrilase-related carbon-nitrogen hydrolase n=1 Tax=Pseudonocardia sp. T1-2H TaxID=3128899 RepID=UPI004053E489
MPEPLPIAAAQPRIEPHDVEANALAHAAAVRESGARVVVFPELSLTGYELDAAVITTDDPRLAPLVDACAETGSIALAGAPLPGDHIAILAVAAAEPRSSTARCGWGTRSPRDSRRGTRPPSWPSTLAARPRRLPGHGHPAARRGHGRAGHRRLRRRGWRRRRTRTCRTSAPGASPPSTASGW